MSALPIDADDAAPQPVPMSLSDLDAVVALEQVVYPFPWTRGNFVDSLAAGHVTQLLRSRTGALLAYCVALPGVEEMHLLNLTVAPALQGRGLARRLLDRLVVRCRDERRGALWLEVRESNQRARADYGRYGFTAVGLRRGYYPAAGAREDAVVMRLSIALEGEAGALD
jgi:ribosomal-protein-alanine N-acetyltransferase